MALLCSNFSFAPLFLQELPERWETTKKIAVTVRHEVSPLQNAEVTLIRKKCILFDVSQLPIFLFGFFFLKKAFTKTTEAICLRFIFNFFCPDQRKQAEFRERFRLSAPFGFNAENPYAVLDKVMLISVILCIIRAILENKFRH